MHRSPHVDLAPRTPSRRRATLAVALGLAVLAVGGCVGQLSAPPSDPAASPDAAAGGDRPDGAPPATSDGRPPSLDAAPVGDAVIAVWLGTGAYDAAADGRIDPYRLGDDAVTAGTSTRAGSLPSWIAPSRDGRHLYAVDENNSRVRVFAVAAG